MHDKRPTESLPHLLTILEATMSVSKEDSVKVGLKDGRVNSIDGDDRAPSGRRGSTRVELLVLCAVTTVIWLLLLLPIVIYSQIPVEPSQNCTTNGRHLVEEFNFNELRMSNLSNIIGNHLTSNTNAASGEHQIPLSRIFDCSNITCQQGFYCEEPEDSFAVCSPNCYTWTQFSRSTSIAIDFIILLAECVGVVSGVAIFIVAGMRWRNVLVFPSSLAVYQTIPAMVLSIIIIISRTSSGILYCRSKDLQESLHQPTPFCTFTGAVTYYCLFLLAVLWLCHLVALFWKMKFPLSARSFQKAHRMKYIHIACTAFAFIFPAIPVVIMILYYTYDPSSAEAEEGNLGFGITRFPPLLCTGRQGSIIIYLIAAPSIAMIMAGIALTASLFWIIHKHHGLFTERHSQSKNKISAAERKILIVFVYEVIVLLLIVYGRILDVRDRERFLSEIDCYFQCESNGVDPDNPCNTSTFMNHTTLTMTTISYILLGLFPLVNFLFIVNIRVLNQHLEKWLRPCYQKRPRKAKDVSGSVTPNQDTSTSSSAV